jgi:hypothetical protein|eukprot:scaffold387_cov195-Alexandrium_tamarense.AAC.11
MGIWNILAKTGCVLTILWSIKSLIAYRFWSLDQVMDDVASSPLPLNKNGLDFWQNDLSVNAYYDIGSVKKQARIRFHTFITAVIAVGLCIQFIKRIRQNNISIHRWVGRATIASSLLAYPHFAKLLGGFDQQVARYTEYPVLALIPYFGIKGWRQIRNKKVAEHRSSMIMFSACFYYFGVSRLVLMVMNPLHSGVLAKYTGLGDWREWEREDAKDALTIAIVLAFPLTFGVATYNAYILPSIEATSTKGQGITKMTVPVVAKSA